MKSKSREKGQYLIVEEMILFALGLMMALGFLSIFHVFGEETKEQTGKEQLELLGEIISSHIMELTQSGEEGSITFSLPPTVGSEEYFVELTTKGIVIQTQRGKVYASPVFGLEKKFYMTGAIESGVKKASLTLRGNTINLRA